MPEEAESAEKQVGESRPSRSSGSVLFGLLGKLALLAVAIAVGGLLAEGMVRVFAPQQLIIKRPDIWMGSDSLGWTHRPNVSTTLNTGERTVHVYTDSLGNRVGRTPSEEAEYHVLFLGDSYTEAFQVEYRNSFAGILERELSRRVGEPVNVDNTAVGGWGPPQYLREARASLRRKSYDLVAVFLYIGNDVVSRRPSSIPRRTPTEVHDFRIPKRLSYQELIDAWLYPVNDFLEVRSEAFILFKRSARQILRKIDLTAGYFPEVFLKRSMSTDRWSVTADICEEISEIAESRGSPTVFVLIPAPFQVNEAQFRRAIEGFDVPPEEVAELDAPNRLLSEELRKRGLLVVDPLMRLREAADSGSPLYGNVDRHLSPRGHRVVAEYLAGRLLPHAIHDRDDVTIDLGEEGS